MVVRSRDGSPVRYNALDPRRQLWVVACFYGPLDDESTDAVYAHARKLGTTGQVREDMWPADRAAFENYRTRSLVDPRSDPQVRAHLCGVAAVAFLPAPLRAPAGGFNLFATTGFLPDEFCAHMNLDRSADQQRRFERLLPALRLADRVIPRGVWLLGYQMYLWDMRVRNLRGKRIV